MSFGDKAIGDKAREASLAVRRRRVKEGLSTVKTVEISMRYKPRAYQLPFLQAMESGIKRAMLVWHRRAGKDLTVFNYLLSMMMRRPGNYYYYFPTFAQGRKILWQGKDKEGVPFLDYVPKEVMKGEPHDTEMRFEMVNKSLFQVMGTDDPDRLVGPNPVGVVFSEYSLQDPQAWELVRPILLENKGWAVFVFTPRGENHAYKLFLMAEDNKDWFCELRTIEDTKLGDGDYVISPKDVEKEIAEGMDPDLARQEYYCAWEGPKQGSYYSKQLAEAKKSGRITRVPYDPALLVNTAWDFGIGDYTTIWLYQIVGSEIRFINYISNSGEGLPYYVKLLKELPYTYDRHLAPHDVTVREYGSGNSRLEIADSLGIRFEATPKLPKEDGIEAVRRLFPRFWFDEDNCREGINALKAYSRQWDPTTKSYREAPRHDWASHGADSMRVFALGHSDVPAMTHRTAEGLFNPLCMQEEPEEDYAGV